jgi:hypothetical protein
LNFDTQIAGHLQEFFLEMKGEGGGLFLKVKINILREKYLHQRPKYRKGDEKIPPCPPPVDVYG